MNALGTTTLERPASCISDAPARRQEVAVFGCPTWKRVLDLFLIAITMPLWLPLMIVIAAGIKIVSPGCVFFRQERVGHRGRTFMVFKFRSMKVNAETKTHEQYYANLMQGDRPMTKLDAGDPRIIPLGRLLRASGLDELPQIINVMRGEMSLVGPRPCTVREFANYEPAHRSRVDSVPGLTGLWQVNGKNRTTFNEMVAMDINYSKTMSLRLDLLILLKTFPTVACQVWEARNRKRSGGQAGRN